MSDQQENKPTGKVLAMKDKLRAGQRFSRGQLVFLLSEAHKIMNNQARLIDELRKENDLLRSGKTPSGLILPPGMLPPKEPA